MESFVQGKGDNHRIISSWPQSWCLADGAAQQEAAELKAELKLAEPIRAHESAQVISGDACQILHHSTHSYVLENVRCGQSHW